MEELQSSYYYSCVHNLMPHELSVMVAYLEVLDGGDGDGGLDTLRLRDGGRHLGHLGGDL